MTASEKVTALIDSLCTDPNAIRLKKLLFCICHERWPSHPQDLDPISWFELLQQVLARATDIDRLQNALIVIVSHLNKKSAYFMLARSLFNRLKVLYPDYRGDITSMGDRFAQVRQLFDDSQDLFSLRLRISHHSSLSKAKGIVFSAISCRFNYTTQDLNYLNQQDFDDLVRELLYACNSIEDLRFRVFRAASCLDDRDNNLKVATLLCGTIASFYPILHQQRSAEFLAGNASLDDFDRMTAGDISVPEFESDSDLSYDPNYHFNSLNDSTVMNEGTTETPRNKSVSPATNTPAIMAQWSAKENLPPGISSDIKNYADRHLHATITNLEHNLQTVSDYIDANLKTETRDTNAYKYQILRELVEGLQDSCTTQLARLAQLQADESSSLLPET